MREREKDWTKQAYLFERGSKGAGEETRLSESVSSKEVAGEAGEEKKGKGWLREVHVSLTKSVLGALFIY